MMVDVVPVQNPCELCELSNIVARCNGCKKRVCTSCSLAHSTKCHEKKYGENNG